MALYGRDAELGRIASLLTSVNDARVARALRLAGPSGIGKTAVLDAAANDASPDFLVVRATGFRIHASLELLTAKRIANGILDVLASDAQRYISGLDLQESDPKRFEESFYRFVEAITLDRPLLLALDDAQWVDEPTCRLIERCITGLANHPIAFLWAERNDETGGNLFEIHDETIALAELSAGAMRAIVAKVYPEATEAVMNGISEAAKGRPIEAIEIAQAARNAGARTASDVADSARRVIAREISALPANVRSFLQTCALIDEPIELQLLSELFEERELLDLLNAASGKYLIQDGASLRFVHTSVAIAIRETIPIEVPYRRRIIAAMQRLGGERLEDYERLAKQAAACGDRDLERATLLTLSQSASAKSLYNLAASAMERALMIAHASNAELVPLYTTLSQLYNALGRESDCIRICRQGLAVAKELGIDEGRGAIAASLIVALYHSGQYDLANSEYKTYSELCKAPSDQAQLISIAEYIAVNALNTLVERLSQRFENVREHAHPLVILRHHTAQAFLWQRLGNRTEALTQLETAERLATALPSFAATLPRAARVFHTLRFEGVGAAEPLLEDRIGELAHSFLPIARANAMLAKGRLDDAHDYAWENSMRFRDDNAHRQLVGIAGIAAALSGVENEALWHAIEMQTLSFMNGNPSHMIFPIATASLVRATSAKAQGARNLLTRLVTVHSRPVEQRAFLYPVFLSIAAQQLGARDILERLADSDGLFSDGTPWSRAHVHLAQAIARKALDRPDAGSHLTQVRQQLDDLGNIFFAKIASEALEAVAREARGGPAKTTRREREIAGLVAEGLTNREIAERLVLSERTVEGHIANLFAKLNVSSRTQVAAWHLRSTSSVA